MRWVREWVRLAAEDMVDQREYLIELDREIGDGDHGENMARGFTFVTMGSQIDEGTSGREVLLHTARGLLSSVGGAAGPLYATVFLRAADVVDEEHGSPNQVVNILRAAIQGVQDRGKAQVGEKTMVDALDGALRAATQAAANQQSLVTTWEEAAAGAVSGAQATKPLRATKGRASYLGERSVGHLDPGAVSTAALVEAAAKAAQNVYGNEERTE